MLGAGGVLTELLRDSVSLLPPFTAATITDGAAAAAGGAAARRASAAARPGTCRRWWQRALACTRYAAANLERLAELDLNPVIVRPPGRGAVAVDALIRLVEEH